MDMTTVDKELKEMNKLSDNDSISIRQLNADEATHLEGAKTVKLGMTPYKQQWAKHMIFSALEKPKLKVLKHSDVDEWLAKQ